MTWDKTDSNRGPVTAWLKKTRAPRVGCSCRLGEMDNDDDDDDIVGAKIELIKRFLFLTDKDANKAKMIILQKLVQPCLKAYYYKY